MLFNSLHFALFFPLVVGVYYLIPHRYRWTLLLIASYYFYMSWNPAYILLIVASTIIDYFAALRMGATEEKSKRKRILAISLLFNLGMLFLFKYFNFFRDSLLFAIPEQYNLYTYLPRFSLLLPVGISFYTFQTLSYSIDVYRGDKAPEKHFGIFALYVAFFPQLVAGPIERSVRLLPQFHQKINFDYERVTSGLRLMMWGLFKKVVIADQVAFGVSSTFNDPFQYKGAPLVAATYLFAFQIYCDFSGYSDMAIGAARILGFDLMENFRQPYFSKSIREFWSRWHISLSTWFRDYLYIPLGGNRVGKSRWYINLMIVFVVSGLWHGANWTFIIWGALHGFYLVFSIVISPLRKRFEQALSLDRVPRLYGFIQMAITFHLVLLAWVFFRANTVTEALYIIRNLPVGLSLETILGTGPASIRGTILSGQTLAIALGGIAIMETVHILQVNTEITKRFKAQPVWLRWGVYYAGIIGIFLLGSFGPNEFIYFQF